MESFFSELSQEQLIWYSKLLVKVVLADNIITPSELKYIKSVLSRIEDQGQRKTLVSFLEKNVEPPLEQPKDLSPTLRAKIFILLTKVVISDNEFEEAEKKLLKKIAAVFDFYPGYTKDVIEWACDGVLIKEIQQELAKRKITDESSIVPLTKLNTDQKKWYIDAIIAALIHEGIKEEKEINILKAIFASTESKEEQILLRNHMMLQHRPPIKRAPPMHEQALIMILMEVIMISVSRGDLSYAAQQHIKLLTDVSRMKAEAYNKLMDWMNKRLSWKKREMDLINNVRLNTSIEDEEDRAKGILTTHPDNNAIQIRKVHCFACGSAADIPMFQLKHLSQKITSNIFGVPSYHGPNEGFDAIDYNLARVIVCPACLFASIHKEDFATGPQSKTPPELADARFKEGWVNTTLEREEFVGSHKDAMLTIDRSPEAAILSFKLAYQALVAINSHKPSEAGQAKLINLLLQMSDIQSHYKNVTEAEEELDEACRIAKNLFIKGRDDKIAARATRVLLLGALYHSKDEEMGNYIDYFHNYAKDKVDLLPMKDRQEFQKIYTDVLGIFDKRELYKKAALIKGFHLNTKLEKKKKEDGSKSDEGKEKK